MKKRFLIISTVILINVIAMTTLLSTPSFAAEGYDGQYLAYPCFCEGQTFPDEMECETYLCQEGDLWVCYEIWGPIPCGDPILPPPAP